MNVLLSVCGRGGSKGLKNKNSKDFLGFPLILYTLSVLDLFKKQYYTNFNSIDISVNSDSNELLEISELTKLCTTIKRPEQLAQDNSPKLPVMQYSLLEMEKKYNKNYELIIDFDITSPLRTVANIIEIIKSSIASDNEVIFSVVNSRRNPYFNMVEENDHLISRVKSSTFITRQQAPKVYDMNASIYSFKRDALINTGTNLFEKKCGIYLMKDTAVLDIDSEDDFILMEILAENYFYKFREFNEVRNNISTIYEKV
jgi:CMP-N,N'-diacetyllegionaminic acid synthase